MFDIVNDIKAFLLSILNNKNYIDIISMVVVAFTSYRVAKYNSSKPSKLKIKQQQLDCVYLPLFRLFITLPLDIDKKTALRFSKKLSHILEKNYVLAFPQLHELSKDLEENILKNEDYIKTLRIIKHQVCIDYELLKNTLGYPSKRFYQIFIRMTFKQKMEFIFSYLNVVLLLFLFFLAPVLSNSKISYLSILVIGVGVFISSILVEIVWLQRLKD